ncbi:hypothetical protein [Nocardia sp. NPDC051570]|uniref:hypothetical protein n=1 Tax=Nocardia sp. NPDC051570 TaxID=3364324 RepID=UPI0037BC4CC3
MGCLTVAAVAMAGNPAVVAASPNPIPGSGDPATQVGEARDALSQLHPLDAAETPPLRDRLIHDVETGAVPLHAAEAPAWDKVVAFRLPDERTMVALPFVNAAGDSLGVLYDTNGAISRRIEVRTVTMPDQSIDATIWDNDEAPIDKTYSPSEQHDAATKEVFLGPLCGSTAAAAFFLPLAAPFLIPFVFIPFFNFVAVPLLLAIPAAWALLIPLCLLG